MWVKVTEDYNPVFAPLWIIMFILFNGRDGHGRDGIADGRAESLIFGLRYYIPCMLIKPTIFLRLCSVPQELVVCWKIIVIEEGRGFEDR